MDHRHGSATGPCACADIPDHMACEAKRRRPSRWGEALARAPGLRPAQRDVGRRRPRASAGRRRFAPTERARFAPGPDDLCPCCSAQATGILDTTNRAHFEPKSGHRPKRVIRVSEYPPLPVRLWRMRPWRTNSLIRASDRIQVLAGMFGDRCWSHPAHLGCRQAARCAPRRVGIGNGAESAARPNRTRKCVGAAAPPTTGTGTTPLSAHGRDASVTSRGPTPAHPAGVPLR